MPLADAWILLCALSSPSALFYRLFSAPIPGLEQDEYDNWGWREPSQEWFNTNYTVGEKPVTFMPLEPVDKMLDPEEDDGDLSMEQKIESFQQYAFFLESSLKNFVDNVSDAPHRRDLKTELKALKKRKRVLDAPNSQRKKRKRTGKQKAKASATATELADRAKNSAELLKKIKSIKKKLRHVVSGCKFSIGFEFIVNLTPSFFEKPRPTKSRRQDITKHLFTNEILRDKQVLQASLNVQKKLFIGTENVKNKKVVVKTSTAWLDPHVSNRVGLPAHIRKTCREIDGFDEKIKKIKKSKEKEEETTKGGSGEADSFADDRGSEHTKEIKSILGKKAKKELFLEKQISEYAKKRVEDAKKVPKETRMKKYAESFQCHLNKCRIEKNGEVHPNTPEATFVRTIAFMMAGHIDPDKYT